MNVAHWVAEIDVYEEAYAPWYRRGDGVVKRYKDERSGNNKAQKFAILWSNTQTLQPALYDKEPTPNIERRFKDDDDLARVVSEVLERSITYFIKTDLFNSVMNQTVLDRLLQGRGMAWVRYVPDMQESTEPEQVTSTAEEPPLPELYSEDIVFDYVDVKDFGHTVARTWAEVTAGWRKAYLDRKQLIKRFPEHGELIPLDAKRLGSNKKDENGKKATIYEIWCKTTKKVYWIHRDYPEILDEKPDPLRLKGFFPFPKPLYATLANDTLIPIPDYVQYQDQAHELDTLTARIALLTSALKVAGVYDANAEGVQKILTDNLENKLYPVSSWAMFAQNGGLKGAIDFLPIDQIAAVLTGLSQIRDRIKQDIYEITGISDIIRGASDPNETLGAQELKGKYAGLRLGAMQRDVARFSRELVEIGTEIIAEHFDLETIKQISGVKLLTNPEKQQINILMQQYQMMAAQAQQMQQPAPPPLVDKKTMELMKLPSWEDIDAIIRQDMPRCFIIDIETDSTIKADQDAEKAARTEFLAATGSFIQQAAVVQDPAMKQLLMEMLMFGMRGFKAGRTLEGAFKTAMDSMREQDDAPKQPSPEEIKSKQEVEIANKEFSLKAKEINLQEQDLLFKKQQAAADAEVELGKQQTERFVASAEAASEAGRETASNENNLSAIIGEMQRQSQATNQALMAIAEGQKQIASVLAQMATGATANGIA